MKLAAGGHPSDQAAQRLHSRCAALAALRPSAAQRPLRICCPFAAQRIVTFSLLSLRSELLHCGCAAAALPIAAQQLAAQLLRWLLLRSAADRCAAMRSAAFN